MLAALVAEQRTLDGVLRALPADPRQVLLAGEAVLQFAGHEEQALAAVSPLLDPAVHAELAREHEEFGEDLELLRWLLETTPDSPDVAVLTASLVRRMRQHVERDGRLLARAVLLVQ